jgi:1-acyl-sn-glycerol-3-phosphate acyltransferase
LFATLRAFLFMGIFFPLTFPIALSAIFCTLLDRSGRCYAAHARFWGRLGIWMAGARVTVSGVERLPAGPIVVMSNHASNFDILALQGFFPRQLSWIAKKELFNIPIFGHSMRLGGYIPLDRGDGRKALKSMDEAAGQIRGGTSVIIFPEGTRTRDGKLLPFKRGGFLLAVKAGVPVVPVTINGSFQINPGGALQLYPGDITIQIQTAIAIPEGIRRAAAEDSLMEQVQHAINQGLPPS